MTIRASFASEETLGVSGNDRQHGIITVISELAEELSGDHALNILGVQGCGSYELDTGVSTVIIVRVIKRGPNNEMVVVGVAILSAQGVMIEASDQDVAHLFYSAVEIYGLRSGDKSVIKHDSRPPKEDEE
jgi:hypothetical protein